jgi:hypothetical protein
MTPSARDLRDAEAERSIIGVPPVPCMKLATAPDNWKSGWPFWVWAAWERATCET